MFRVCNWGTLSDWHPVTCSARSVRIIRRINEQLYTAVVYLITISQSLSVTIRCNKPHHFRTSGCNISTFLNNTLTRMRTIWPILRAVRSQISYSFNAVAVAYDWWFTRSTIQISTISRVVDVARSIFSVTEAVKMRSVDCHSDHPRWQLCALTSTSHSATKPVDHVARLWRPRNWRQVVQRSTDCGYRLDVQLDLQPLVSWGGICLLQ